MSRSGIWFKGFSGLACAIGTAFMLLAAGCATAPERQTGLPANTMASTASSWSGRMSLQVDSDPPRQYSASFELSGSAEMGELRLSSPFGQLLAQAQWREGAAVLQRGELVQAYPDLDTLTSELVGARLPVAALFDWLRGQATAVEGWQVDLQDLTSGRLRAQRLQPAPAASLRIVIP